MKLFIIFYIFIPSVYSEIHRFMTTYTGINGKTAAGTPEFSAVTTLDGHQIDYYDSDIKKMIPRQDWMEDFKYKYMWGKDTEIREQVQQIYRNNIHVLMKRFNQTHGVHTYQRVYGCEWDDVTGESHGFDRYTYDGQEFITLRLRKRRYTAHVPQAIPTVEKWNNDSEQFTLLKRYYNHECVYWMTYFLELRKGVFKRREPTEDYKLVCVVVVLVICALMAMKSKQKLQKIYQNLKQIRYSEDIEEIRDFFKRLCRIFRIWENR